MLTKRLVLLFGVSVSAFAVSPALAEVKEGDDAPEITAVEWFNLPGDMEDISQKDLKGQIIVLDFWATWCGPCERSIPHLVEMQKKYKSKGVILLALSPESASKVEKYVKKQRIPYVVGGGAERTRSIYGVSAYPTTYLIAPDGKVVWKGGPVNVEDQIRKLIESNPAKSKGFLAEKSAAAAYKKASKLDKDGDYVEAWDLYMEITREFKGTKVANKAKSKLKKMRQQSRVMRVIKKARTDKTTFGWLECARVCVMYGDTEDAMKYYKRIIDKYPDCEAAKFAREELRLHVEDEDEEDEEDEDGGDKDKDEDEDEDEEDD
ncbi:MAG: redoxin domain-containing protein [Planctomycetota bacterium]